MSGIIQENSDHSETLALVRRGYNDENTDPEYIERFVPHSNTPHGRLYRIGQYYRANNMPMPREVRLDFDHRVWADTTLLEVDPESGAVALLHGTNESHGMNESEPRPTAEHPSESQESQTEHP